MTITKNSAFLFTAEGKKSIFLLSLSEKFPDFLTELTKLLSSLKVTAFFFSKLNKAAMCFVFVNVALLETDVGTSFS